MLTEIHRQAADSPIIRLATEIREGKFAARSVSEPGLTVCTKQELNGDDVLNADAVIVGKNTTRTAYNKRLRELRGYTDLLPQKGEQIICLRNDSKVGIVNGEIFKVETTKLSKRKAGRVVNMALSDPDDADRSIAKVSVYEHFFKGQAADLEWQAKRSTQEFDFAAAITCHKAQGSQYPRVCAFDESAAFREDRRRWLYTAVTRASSSLTLVI